VDEQTDRFFMRVSFTGSADVRALAQEIKAVLPSDAQVEVIPPVKKRVLICVTKEHHCLGDLLIKSQFQDLSFTIVGVIGNHAVLAPLCAQFLIPFIHVPAEGYTREEHEAQLKQIIDAENPDLIVLAKYMRILTPAFASAYLGKMLNIHHSFLPAFVGANPYQQAFQRGVKIIGATAHFVTDDLDEGPIICQEVVSVNHSYDAKQMSKAGKEVEKMVLAKALQLVLEDRVFIHENKTILFD
jgi:formyltetrahydrofolate deformylase